MLVNTARALKYLESNGQRQSQLFTLLEKYHQVCDGLEDMKSQFSFLKEAISRNIENIQQAITVQQTYTTNLCGHVNVILSRLTKLENDIQKLTEKFTMEQDMVQIDVPDFDPDIDGPNPQRVHHNTVVVSVQELFTSSEPESINATSTQEEHIVTNSIQDIPIQKIPIGLVIPPPTNSRPSLRLQFCQATTDLLHTQQHFR